MIETIKVIRIAVATVMAIWCLTSACLSGGEKKTHKLLYAIFFTILVLDAS